MRIFLLKDIENIGMAGEIVKVEDGFGRNYLLPRNLGQEVTSKNEQQFAHRIRKIEHRKEVIASKTSMLAEKIKSLKLQMKRKAHDKSKLFGSISSHEIVDLLAEKGISITKNQVDFGGKSIKTTGNHTITVKLSSKLQPSFSLTIIPEHS